MITQENLARLLGHTVGFEKESYSTANIYLYLPLSDSLEDSIRNPILRQYIPMTHLLLAYLTRITAIKPVLYAKNITLTVYSEEGKHISRLYQKSYSSTNIYLLTIFNHPVSIRKIYSTLAGIQGAYNRVAGRWSLIIGWRDKIYQEENKQCALVYY